MISKSWTSAAVLLVAVAAWAATPTDPGIPAVARGYRAWTRLSPEPRPVPYDQAIQCSRITRAQIGEALRIHGPHANRWIVAYANPTALAAMKSGTFVFPAGSILVKEKLLDPYDTKPEGTAFMIKHRSGEFAASNGWEFLYTPSKGSPAVYDGCVNCHRAGAARDYVFSTYEKSRK